MNPPETPHTPEDEPTVEPKIYVASLTDYNHGTLHGAWITADRDAAQIYDQTQAMLAASPTARRLGQPAEEWAIHDYQGFGALSIGEHDDFHLIAQLARGITDHGPAFAAWVSHHGKNEIDPAEFEDVYVGEWSSVRDYAEHILDDLGYLDEINKAVPDYLKPYVAIDTSAFSRDLILSGDIWAHENEHGKVWIFDGRG